MQSADAVKIVVLGGSSAGKTSLLARFANDEFQESRTAKCATIGVGFLTKSIMVGTERVKLHMWDTVGSERYNSVTRMYYRGAQACILCYDITDQRSFADIQFWAQELTRNEPDCRMYLCGCKLDMQLERRQVSVDQARNFADGKGAAFFETSARTGENVVALFNRICMDAVNWRFVSITTGKVTCNPEAATPSAANDGNRKSFNLMSGQNQLRGHEGGGCAAQKCQIA